MASCFDCKYGSIYEKSHEWLERYCKFDGSKGSPFRLCENHEPKPLDDDDEGGAAND